MRLLSAILIAIVLAACGGGEPDAPDTTSAASDTVAVVDTSLAGIPEAFADDDGSDVQSEGQGDRPGDDRAADAGPPVRGQGSDDPQGLEAPPSAGDNTASLAGRYRLALVEGESPPVTIDENPDCKVELVRGDLQIRNDQSFELMAESRTTCGGELINTDRRQAEGTVERSGDRLRFEAASEEIFATAVGTFTSGGHIDVDGLEFGGESTTVDWRFLR